MTQGFFVAGTDTGVGKTRVGCALLSVLGAQPGRRVAAMKPVASGTVATAVGPRNADALALQAAANVEAAYDDINPFLFPVPTAPHLAAADAGVEITPGVIAVHYTRLASRADVVIVEGAGGWLTPIGPAATMADVAQRLRLRVVLVVGLRLGCLNHAMLTVEAIHRSGLELAGWVENRLDPDPGGVLAGYPQALAERIPAPRLGQCAYDPAEPPGRPWVSGIDATRVEAMVRG